MVNGEYFLMCLKAAAACIPTSLWIAGVTFVISVVLGTGIALLRAYRVPVAKQVFDVLMALSKALPTNLVLLIVLVLVTSNFTSVMAALHLPLTIKDLSVSAVAVAALVICTVPGISEVIRGGLLSVEYGQYEAGYAMGLTRIQTFFLIIVPQVFRAVIPPLTSSTLTLVKGTALVSVIGVIDIMNGARNAASWAYCYLEAYLAAALIFWVIGALLEWLSRAVERRFARSIRILSRQEEKKGCH